MATSVAARRQVEQLGRSARRSCVTSGGWRPHPSSACRSDVPPPVRFMCVYFRRARAKFLAGMSARFLWVVLVHLEKPGGRRLSGSVSSWRCGRKSTSSDSGRIARIGCKRNSPLRPELGQAASSHMNGGFLTCWKPSTDWQIFWEEGRKWPVKLTF